MYRGAIERVQGQPSDGAPVVLTDWKDCAIAWGVYNGTCGSHPLHSSSFCDFHLSASDVGACQGRLAELRQRECCGMSPTQLPSCAGLCLRAEFFRCCPSPPHAACMLPSCAWRSGISSCKLHVARMPTSQRLAAPLISKHIPCSGSVG